MTIFDALPKQIQDLLTEVATKPPADSRRGEWQDENGFSMLESGKKALKILTMQSHSGEAS